MCIPAVSLIILSFTANNILAAMILFTIALGSCGAINASVYISPLDISPNYAGIISGLTFLIGTSTSILSPLSFGYIVTDAVRKLKYFFLNFFLTYFIYSMIYHYGKLYFSYQLYFFYLDI